MQLLDHVSISVSSIKDCSGFYDAVMQSLGCKKVYGTDEMLGYGSRCKAGEEVHSYLAIVRSATANVDDARHWCFKSTTRTMVDEFYVSGLASGGICNGPPGLRKNYHSSYYGAFLFDPFGNRIETVCHSEC